MSIGSHKDAFKAHQLVKKLIQKGSNAILASMAAEILLDFVKSQRQLNLRGAADILPNDSNTYDQEKLNAALEAVSNLCGGCEEAHDDACFVNQARRILIAAKTGVDIGLHFDGKKNLKDLLREAELIAAVKVGLEKNVVGEKAVSAGIGDNEQYRQYQKEIINLRNELDSARDKEIFRDSLIDEIVATIQNVANGNYAAEMPVHDDLQLGKLSMAFNLMLQTVQTTVSHLDQLVAVRNVELKNIMETVPFGLLSLDAEFRVNPEYSRASEAIFGAAMLRGRNFLDLIGLTARNTTERNQLLDFFSLLQMGIISQDMDRLNPVHELQLPKGNWVRLNFRLLSTGEKCTIMVEAADITENKNLQVQVEQTRRESEQIIAIAENPESFRSFLRDINLTISHTTSSIEKLFSNAESAAPLIDQVFRNVHTIKGIAGSYGMHDTGHYAADLEDLLEILRKNSDRPQQLICDFKIALQKLADSNNAAINLAAKILRVESPLTAEQQMHVPVSLLKHLACYLRKSPGKTNEATELLAELEQIQCLPASKGLEMVTRLVPGLINRLNKKVKFEVNGENTPLPFDLARDLTGPLAHIIRNALDHGIEAESHRLANGKPLVGKVTLSTRSQEWGYEISVEDDGQGMNPEILRNKAIEKGIINSEAASNMTSEDCLQLIFVPGFSTKETISEISGRGVGMDAVRDVIKHLSGNILVESIPGRGSRFTIEIPSSSCPSHQHAAVSKATEQKGWEDDARLDSGNDSGGQNLFS